MLWESLSASIWYAAWPSIINSDWIFLFSQKFLNFLCDIRVDTTHFSPTSSGFSSAVYQSIQLIFLLSKNCRLFLLWFVSVWFSWLIVHVLSFLLRLLSNTFTNFHIVLLFYGRVSIAVIWRYFLEKWRIFSKVLHLRHC